MAAQFKTPRSWVEERLNPIPPKPEKPWKGPTVEPYPEDAPEMDLENPNESYEDLLDDVDQMPPTMAHRTLARAHDAVHATYGAETQADEEFRPAPAFVNMRGLERVRTLVAHHALRALEYHVESTLTLADWARIRLSHDGVCPYCGERCNRMTIDHVIAMSRGGPNTPANIVAACGACNLSKGPKDVTRWIAKQGFDVGEVFGRINAARERQVTL